MQTLKHIAVFGASGSRSNLNTIYKKQGGIRRLLLFNTYRPAE